MAVGEVDVFLVEDGCPLEGGGWDVLEQGNGEHEDLLRTMLCLTGGAVAELAVERLAAAQLVFNLAAVAVGCVLGVEVVGLLMDGVGRTLLPLGDAGRRLAAALVFVHSSYCGGEACKLWSCEVGS